MYRGIQRYLGFTSVLSNLSYHTLGIEGLKFKLPCYVYIENDRVPLLK